MSEEFLTIKEAAQQTGKAEVTIRRFVQRIVKSGDANMRAMLRPTPEEKANLTDGSPPAWRISTVLLQQYFPKEQQGSDPNADKQPGQSRDGDVVTVLTKQNTTLEQQLAVKDRQIQALTSLVESLGGQLNERLRESNILMKGFQDALPARSTAQVNNPESAKPNPAPGAAKPKRDEPKQSKRPKPKPRGWWGRLLKRGKPTT